VAFADSLKTPIGWIGYKYDSSFASFAKIKISVIPQRIVAGEGKEFSMKCRFEIPAYYSSFILSHPLLKDTTRIGLFNKNGWIKDVFTGLSLQKMNEKKGAEIQVNPALAKGKYYLIFSINNSYYNATHNSDKIGLIIK